MSRFVPVMVVVSSTVALALYSQVDTEQVPVERVVNNLSAAVESADGGSATLWLALGRVHAMAAWAPLQEITVLKVKERPFEVGHGVMAPREPDLESWVWFGYEPQAVPFAAVTADVPAKSAAHLKAALAAYDRADRLRPRDPVVLMGKGWLLARSGRKSEAIVVLKQTYELLRAGATPSAQLGVDAIVEVIGYLKPLLDPVRDAALLAGLEATRRDRAKLGRMVTPLVIPLEKNTSLSDALDGAPLVTFDADGSGLQRTWTWITPRAGWLVYAPKGTVDSALQLFGSVTFWLFFDDGYQALSVLDDDHDGRIAGAEREGLSVWIDADGDAVTDAGELHSLPSLGITSVACSGAKASNSKRVTAMHETGVTLADGSTRPTWDVVLSSPALITLSPR